MLTNLLTQKSPRGALAFVAWGAQLVAAAILLQTAFFKLTAAPESIALFETLGVEPFGRISTGLFEVVAGVLLLVPRVAGLGGALGVGLMGGAILSHLTVLGIEVQGDGGALFGMAIAVLVSSATVALLLGIPLPTLLRPALVRVESGERV